MTDGKKIIFLKEIIGDSYEKFERRSERLAAFLETYAPNIIIEKEKELVIKSLDNLIEIFDNAKKFISDVEGPTEEETKEFLHN